MKLIENTNQNTKLGLKTSGWEYHKTQIDTDNIKAIKVTAYDNAPDIKHMYEPERYKVKVKIWMKGTDLDDKHDYELTNKLTNYKSFRNNMYKTDQHRDWYIKWVQETKDEQQKVGCECVAAPLGMRQSTSPNSKGYMHVPRWAFSMFMMDDNQVGRLYIEDYKFDVDFNDIYMFKETQCFTKEFVFE
jgi:hypothetical protein